MSYYIGIDLGGTNVRIAKVDEQGNVISPYTARFEIQTYWKDQKRLSQIFLIY